MTKKAIITWVGVVSGILTILLAFGNPFSKKASLSAYVTSHEFLEIPSQQEESKFSRDHISKIEITNTGDLPARKVYVKLNSGYNFAQIIAGKEKFNHEKSEDIYIDIIEPDQTIEIFFWSSFSYISSRNIDERISISSQDSGKASIRTDITGDGFIWYIEQYKFFIPSLIFFLFYMLIMLIAETMKTKDGKQIPQDTKQQLELLEHSWSIGLLSEEEFQEKGSKILKKHIM
ncbi:hypothetical protein [Endozoicomonas lisbonensis]|uniref:SHOCT domain-containing protein n=1 Tax=Endozoicomonas lisbonensis TaxID=3120522 RepID=A0ABV2SD14_9GAMM